MKWHWGNWAINGIRMLSRVPDSELDPDERTLLRRGLEDVAKGRVKSLDRIDAERKEKRAPRA
jgi:hypothetical protein